MNPFKPHKILAHLPVLAKYTQGESVAPILAEIDLTNLCASACPWCAGYRDRKWSKAVLFGNGDPSSSVNGVKQLLDDLKEIGVQAVTWTGGGDPTQHKGHAEIVAYAAELNFEQGFITHGVIDVTGILPYLTWIRFSVDAATVDGYGKQHGKPQHFQRVLDNIEAAAKCKVRRELEVTVGVGFLTHQESFCEIRAFAGLWKDIPVDYIQYRPLHDTHGSHWHSDTDSVIDEIAAAKEIDSRVTCSEVKYHALAAGEDGKTEHCHGIYFETAISADGLVYTCCHHKGNAEFAIGNLKQERFKDIWDRHQRKRGFVVAEQCPAFCRHFGTNELIESLDDFTHKAFI